MRRNRTSRARETRSRLQPSGWRISTIKKSVFALLVTVAFVVGMELILAAMGVRPASVDQDPYVGFSSYAPLFVRDESAAGAQQFVTAKNKTRWFNEQRFAQKKSDGTFRIFCVGGSTTYGRPYQDATSFCGWLREILPAADNARSWEVINAGGISYASYRVAMVMEELTNYEPDLFIVYCGHNEFLEDRTYASIIDTPSSIRGIGSLASRTRVYTAVRNLLRPRQHASSSGHADRELLPSEVKTLLDDGVGPQAFTRDDGHQRQILSHYRYNLDRMVEIARGNGARIIMVQPASKLRSCAPFKSEHGTEFSSAQESRWKQLWKDGTTAEEGERWDDALAYLDEASKMDSRYARLHFARARVLDRLDRHAEAKQAYVRARDEDICPLRALSPMQEIVSEVAAENDVPLIDFVKIMEERSPNGIPGEELFLDHVHPTIEGHRILALALLDELATRMIVRLDDTWNDDRLDEVVNRVESSIDEQAHGAALRNLAKVLNWAGKKEEANRLALRAAEMVTGDANTYYLAGNALAERGELEEAIGQYQQALRIDPNYLEVHNALGANYQRLGQPQMALEHYQKALEIRPSFAPAQSNLGAFYLSQGKTEEAARHFEAAIRSNPRYYKARNNLGVLLLNQGKLPQAAEQFRAVLNTNPQLAEAHFNLGRVMLRQGESDQAVQHFQEALQLDPRYGPAHTSLGLEFARRREYSHAIDHLRRAVRQPRPQMVAIRALAALLATCEDKSLRNGREAVRLAQACVQASQGKEPRFLPLLAAAHAESGDLAQAIKWQTRAVELAPDEYKEEWGRVLADYERLLKSRNPSG